MKKSKKKKLSRKQVIIIIVVVMIFAILSALVSALVTRGVEENPYGAEDVVAIKDIIEKNGCEYISDSKSTVEGYDIDIYLKFGKDTIVDGISSEPYYQTVFSSLVYETGFQNLRLIDESRDIEVKISCSDDGYVTKILINDSENYFDKLMSENAKKNPLEVEMKNMEVDSIELRKLINNDWVTSNVNLGTKESTFDKYDIYFDEGIEIRTIRKKVFNIVFTEKYAKEVVSGIKVGADINEIENRFGTSYKETGIVGYKTNDFYIFFSGTQISVYPNYNYSESNYIEFEKLVADYNENKDITDFMDKLTDIWPDYDLYNYDNAYLEINYTLKGVKISYSSSNGDGIQLYENYNGTLKNNQYAYDVVNYKVDESLMIKNEINRLMLAEMVADDFAQEDLKKSNNFVVEYSILDSERKNKIRIRSKTKEYPNNEFDDTIIIQNYFWIDDNHLVYNIQGKGIYLYNAITRNTTVIVEGTEAFTITDYDRETKTLTYDEKKVVINF